MKQTVSLISRKQELDLKNDGTSVFLKIMISIAVFLFSLTLAGVLSVNSMLQRWNESILGSLTVQIMPITETDKEKAIAVTFEHQQKAIDVLNSIEGIEKVTPLGDAELYSLIQPWLGDGVRVDNLPMPRLLDVKIKKGADIDYRNLAEKLAEASPLASLDNHKLWLSKLINFADGLKVLALTILVMVIIITSGAIFYTTQTSLGLHKYVIEILHQMGAKDTYIAQQYSRRTMILGFWGGVIGLAFAIPSILAISSLASHIEGGIISEASLSFKDWLVILSIPLFSAFISMWTAYYTVKRTLGKMM
ncbi:MAG: hypothetical protein LBL47_03515 [Lactobacillus sp.]|nr:hypothetical protein [Lactobacillus sp.]